MKDIEYKDDIVFGKFINYMKKALFHRRINYMEHQKVLREKELDLEKYNNELSYCDNLSDTTLFEENLESADIQELLKVLTSKQKQVIELNFVKKMTLKSIGKQMNISTKAAEQLKSRAIARIRKNVMNKSFRKED